MNPSGKAAKIIFAIVLIAGCIGGYFFYMTLQPPAAVKEKYTGYQRATATIVSQRGNGRVGKAQQTLWTIRFKDKQDSVHTAEIAANTILGKNNGEEAVVYYNPANPDDNLLSEQAYQELTH